MDKALSKYITKYAKKYAKRTYPVLVIPSDLLKKLRKKSAGFIFDCGDISNGL